MTTAVPINTSAKYNLLQLIQEACLEIAINKPTQIFGNTDPQVLQLLALANREGREFSLRANKNGGWQELRQEHAFYTAGVGGITGNITNNSAVITGMSSTTGIVAGYIASGNGVVTGASVLSIDSSSQVTLDTALTATSTAVALAFGQQSYSLPTDFSYFIQQTFWDRAFRWQLLGPLEAQEWQVLKSGISPVGPRRRFRIMGNLFYIDPVPSEVDKEIFEYYSTGWCQSSTGTAQSNWVADTDYYSLNDDCMILGIIWRYLAAKGFSYDESKRTYDLAVERVMARNGGNRNLPTNATGSGIRLLNNTNVPDTGFGT